MAYDPIFNLSDLDGSNGFVIEGINPGELAFDSGRFVSGAGDINGDGIDDLIVGASDADSDSQNPAGESYVVFGSDRDFSPSLEISDLDGSNGFVINGIDAGDSSGFSVSGAGDINGDGFDDLIIGAPEANPNENLSAGESYVVFGSAQGFDASLELSDLDGSNGFIINGIDAGDSSGFSVSGAGDINGDGFDDLIIGAPDANLNDNDGAGESYVVFGSNQGFSASLELSDLDGSNGFVINGFYNSGLDNSRDLGHSVSGAGDINGDGIDDLVIGAPWASSIGSGESYVVFGNDQGFDANFELSDLDGSNGFAIDNIGVFDNFGHCVSGAGDINGDGFDDLILGTPWGDFFDSGESYVVFGSDQGFSDTLKTSDLDGSNGFAIDGNENGSSGYSVSGAGDLNSDGIDDLIVGAPYADTGGNSYVVFGSDQGFSATLYLSNLDGSNGFVINGIDAFDHSGRSVSGAGDMNGDGIDDLMIGAESESYVVFGGDDDNNPPVPVIEVEKTVDADGDGIFLSTETGVAGGSATFQVAIANTGDVAVTIDEILDGQYDITGSDLASWVGSTLAAGDSVTGTYEVTLPDAAATTVGTAGDDLLDGQQIVETNEVTVDVSEDGGGGAIAEAVAAVAVEVEDTIAGDFGDDTIAGGDGDDILRGDLNSRRSQVGIGGDDRIFGGAGNDRIGGKGGNDQLFGDEGDDLIWGDDGDDLLDGGLGHDVLTGDDFSGGQGSDTFVLAVGGGTDTVVDFEVGTDLIGLAGGLTWADLSFGGSQIQVGEEILAVLGGVDATALPESSFVEIG